MIDYLLYNNFEIYLYDYIIKGKYLCTDLATEKNNDDLFKNFDVNKKKLRRTTVKSKVINLRKGSIILTAVSIKFFNYLLIRDNPIYFEKDIQFFKIFANLNKRHKTDKSAKVFFPSFSERKFSNNHSKQSSHIRYYKAKSIKSSLRRNSSNVNSLFNFKINEVKNFVLTKSFFDRKRDSFINDQINNRKKKVNKKDLSMRKKHKILYLSPLSLTESKSYRNYIPLRKEDKNYTIYKTMTIKNDILKKCDNISEILILYLKDKNISGFRKIYEKYKPNPEISDNDGNSLLNIAVQSGFKKAVIYLINNGANVNTQNNRLNTPLHYALSYQYYDIADILLRNGADEKKKNDEGLTAWQSLNFHQNILK